MSSEAKLDQIVKGAPSPVVSLPDVAGGERAKQELDETKRPGSHSPASDPLALLPSSPPQIYLNLLILEASLRAQYLTLRARRRIHTCFITVLLVWILLFTYLLFYRPREDGKGTGGSPYWVIDMGEKIGWMVGLLTMFLMWATGQVERGLRWPRRWVAVTNRGLRTMNLKIVILKGSWLQRMLSYPAMIIPYGAFSSSQGSAYHYLEFNDKHRASSTTYAYREGYRSPGVRIEDIAPGGDVLRLLLLPKPFSPEFRENWEIYRTEYWEKENERRSELRKVITKRHREAARQRGGWDWWSGSWRLKRTSKVLDMNKLPSTAHHARNASVQRRRRDSAASHSRSSSRSSTVDLDEAKLRPLSRKHRGSITGTRSNRSSRVISADDIPNLSKRASTVSNASSTATESGAEGNGPNVRTRQSRDLEMTQATSDS